MKGNFFELVFLLLVILVVCCIQLYGGFGEMRTLAVQFRSVYSRAINELG
jgi:hypothetical protein